MTPEFRAHERSGCFTIPAPCFVCGCESHGFAEDDETGKDICERCVAGVTDDDEYVHIDEVDNGDAYEYDPGEYEPSEDPRYEGYYDYEDYDYFVDQG